MFLPDTALGEIEPSDPSFSERDSGVRIHSVNLVDQLLERNSDPNEAENRILVADFQERKRAGLDTEDLGRQLVHKNSRLIVHILSQSYGVNRLNPNFMDMYNRAALGILEAAERFDPNGGKSFGSYAGQGIRWEVNNLFRSGEFDLLGSPHRGASYEDLRHLEGWADPDDNPAERLSMKGFGPLKEVIENYIAGLSEIRRRIFREIFFNGISHRQLAQTFQAEGLQPQTQPGIGAAVRILLRDLQRKLYANIDRDTLQEYADQFGDGILREPVKSFDADPDKALKAKIARQKRIAAKRERLEALPQP